MNEASKWFYVVLIGSYNIAMLIVLRVLIKRWAHKGRRFEHLTSLFLVLYMIINMTGLLHNYLDISFETMGMSIIYVVIAGGCILYGFKRKYPSIRYLGLALAVIATGKLFIFDIAYFSTPFFKIVSYFCFGIVLLGISYVYQRFAKKEDGAS